MRDIENYTQIRKRKQIVLEYLKKIVLMKFNYSIYIITILTNTLFRFKQFRTVMIVVKTVLCENTSVKILLKNVSLKMLLVNCFALSCPVRNALIGGMNTRNIN